MYESSSAFALFWNILRNQLPEEVNSDFDLWLKDNTMLRMDTRGSQEKVEGDYSVVHGDNTFTFHGVDMPCQCAIFQTILNLHFPKLASPILTVATPLNTKPPLPPCISTPLCRITPRRTKNNIAIGEDYSTNTLGIPMGYTAE